ncbi:unnamed protein product [Arabis nemorensis]|uniref:TIR domain-containing protein n=1 Tax=Arabis nemorensis TaxID=586526 RepID=A0A565C6Q7_9BRAS|nr:unnamed protein product [Arabis nemorensis]
MASSSSSKYDVFLSFRGEDTRDSIVSHLYAALTSRGLVTFKDDKKFEIGDHISDELHKAIQGSDFVVVVLSENYATSRWCLMELQLTMKLYSEGRLGTNIERWLIRFLCGDKLLNSSPIFQALNPNSDLKKVGTVSIDEAAMVGKIAQDISRRKALMRNIDFKSIVGKDTHMQGLKSLLDMDSNNDELSLQFEASCFTEDIKGIYRDIDLMHLQNKLLYTSLGENISLWSVEAGCDEIKARLRGKNVLLVLDGADKISQVHALAKEISWFGSWSRIIITTRDRGLLNSCGVKTIHEVKCLDDENSLQMFKQIAFEGGSPPSEDFEPLSIRAARLAHGLPSAIQANALFLRGRDNSPEEWEEAVCGLESSPDENIKEILKLSYEGLSKQYQKVFLHVACLFNGETYQRLVEQMGRQIMLDCQKFLGDPEEIHNALVHGAGTELTDLCIVDEDQFNPLFLVELNLRHSNVETLWTGNQGFMNLERLDFTGSNKLKQLPDLSYYKNLDRLILEQCTRLKGIPESIGYKSSIRRLNLSYYGGRDSPMRVGIETINGTQATHCIKLVFPTKRVEMELKHISITGDIEFRFSENCEGYAEYFYISSEQQVSVTTTMSVHLAPKRMLLPKEIGHLEFLEKLDLSGNDFNYLPADTSSLSRLKTLRLRNCRKLKELPELAQVQSITLFNCRSLVKLSNASRDPGRYCLLELCLDNCKNVKSLSDQLSHFTKLTYLDITNHDFETLPSSIRGLTSLVTLCLNNCKKLILVEEGLQFLYAHGCDSLEADDVKHFNETRNKQVPAQTRSPYFQETDKATKSHLLKFLRCSYF